MQGRRENVVRGVEQMHAAILELGKTLRLEHDVPAVDCAVGSEDLTRLSQVVTDACRAPHVIDGVLVAGIVRC